MTPAAFLAVLFRDGASVVVAGDRLRVEAPPGVLTPTIRQGLAAHKADLRRLLPLTTEYGALLRDSALDEAAFREAQARLIDELGPVLAAVIRRAVAQECDSRSSTRSYSSSVDAKQDQAPDRHE